MVRSMFLFRPHWKNMLHITGRPVASLAALIAMIASSGIIIVSMAKRSTPPSAKARACSLKFS